MRKALESLIESINLAGGFLSVDMLRGNVYDLLDVLSRNNIQFYYAGGQLAHTQAGKMYPVPLKDDPNYAVVTVKFEREVTGDELEVLQEQFKAGKIKHDPDQDLARAVVNQLAVELQQAYDDTGVSGHFAAYAVEMGVAIDHGLLAARQREEN